MNRLLYFSLLLGLYLESATSVFAADTPKGGSSSFTIPQPSGAGIRPGNRTGSDLLSALMSNVITTIFVISALGVVIMVLWGAFEWITSGGNKDKLGSAQKRITTALIGAAVLALSFVVLKVVGEVLQFNILGPYTIPKLLG